MDRRSFLAGTAGTAATLAAPRIANAAASSTLRFVPDADLAILDHEGTNMIPLYDVYSALVYAAGPKDVRTTVIHGRVIMEDRKVLTLDVAEVKTRIRAIAGRINAALAAGLKP
jgi:cytosine/adenosine deaminase-related metal-dependent hydrolase